MTENSGYAYNEAGWIVIRDWNEHNPGHTRAYSWIQVKKRLLRHPGYLDLTFGQRGVLLGLWLLTGELGLGRVPSSVRALARLLGSTNGGDTKYLRQHLIALNQAGWFTIDACIMPAQKEKESKKGSSNLREKEDARASSADPPGLLAHAENGRPPTMAEVYANLERQGHGHLIPEELR